MNRLPEELAECFYDIHQRLIFQRYNFSSTSLKSNLWTDLKERDKLEYIEAFTQLLAKKELMDRVRSRGEP